MRHLFLDEQSCQLFHLLMNDTFTNQKTEETAGLSQAQLNETLNSDRKHYTHQGRVELHSRETATAISWGKLIYGPRKCHC